MLFVQPALILISSRFSSNHKSFIHFYFLIFNKENFDVRFNAEKPWKIDSICSEIFHDFPEFLITILSS